MQTASISVRTALGTSLTRHGGKTIGTATVQPGQRDFAPVVASIVSSRADSVFFAGDYSAGGPLLRQLRAGGSSVLFVGGVGLDNRGFIAAAGPSAAESAVVTCPCSPPESSSGDFATRYQTAVGTPAGAFSAAAYDATRIFLAGLEKGVKTRAGMESFVDAYHATGVAGAYRFTTSGDLDSSVARVYLYEVRNGAFTPLGSQSSN